MKILSLLVILLALFRETRHQLPIFYPSFSIPLANEEFIEPPPIVGNSPIEANSNTPPVIINNIEKSDVVPTNSPELSPVSELDGQNNNLPIQDSTRKAGGNADISNNIPPPTQSTTPVLSLQDLQLDSHTSRDAVPSGDSTGQVQEPAVNSQNAKNVIVTEVEGTEENGSHQRQKQSSSPPGPVVIDTPDKEAEVEEPIPSYMEWAQKKQLELKSNQAAAGQNGHSGSPGGNGHGGNHQFQGQNGQPGHANGKNGSVVSSSSGIDSKNYKNFASPDCGAKVVQSNAESQNPSGVLSSSHDEYMLNKCGTNIWFVVELCEPLTVERISIGNLELFSSSPKEVEFGISDRYPTRDWTKIGPIQLPDTRAIHPVQLPATNASTFGKFVKFSVHSHYGSEHYCPISVIKVNGKTEYEVLESETTHQEDENKEGGSLYEEPVEEQTQSAESSGGKVGGLKDAVLNMLNKAVQSIVRRGYSSDSKETNETEQSKCRSILQCVSPSPMMNDIYRLLSCNSSNVLPFLAAHSPWCGWDYCHATFESRSIGLPWQPEGFYASIFGGPTVLHALCHYLKPLTDGCDPSCLAMNNTLQQDSSSEFSNESITNDKNKTITGGFPATVVNTEQESQIPRTISQHEATEEQMSVPPPNPSGSDSTTQPSDQQQQQQMDTPPLNVAGNSQQIPSPDLNNVSPPPPQQQQETQILPPSSITTEDFQQGSGQPQQKESVFVRLTNRIKNLERNQSLTASYLEELSKRFKKQNEDNAIIVDSNKKNLNETRVKLYQLDAFYRQESQSLRRNLDDVRERLFNVQLQRSLLIIICVSQTLLIVGAIIWAKKKFASFGQQLEFGTPTSVSSRRLTLTDILSSQLSQQQDSRRRDSDPLTRQPTNNVDSVDERLLIMRKRSNSDSVPNEKAKRLRKKNKKQQLLNTRNTDCNPNQVKTSRISSDCNPKIPKSSSGDGFFDVPGSTKAVRTGPLIQKNNPSTNLTPFTPKENVDPQFARTTMQPPSSSLGLPKSRSLTNSNSNSPVFQTRPSSLQQSRPNSTLLPRGDLPFAFQSQISPPPMMDSAISTSSRFALLASPVRESHSPSPTLSGRERYFMPAGATSGSSGQGGSSTAAISYNRSGSTESSNSAVSQSPPTSGIDAGDRVRRSSSGFAGIFNGNRHKNQHSPSVSSNDSASISAAVIAETNQEKKLSSSSKKGGGLKAFAKFFER